jgi:hypothetical protein
MWISRVLVLRSACRVGLMGVLGKREVACHTGGHLAGGGVIAGNFGGSSLLGGLGRKAVEGEVVRWSSRACVWESRFGVAQ